MAPTVSLSVMFLIVLSLSFALYMAMRMVDISPRIDSLSGRLDRLEEAGKRLGSESRPDPVGEETAGLAGRFLEMPDESLEWLRASPGLQPQVRALISAELARRFVARARAHHQDALWEELNWGRQS